jgi:hypothetical protein
MSLIYKCQLNGAHPFEYLTELQQHAKALAACPNVGTSRIGWTQP